MRCTGHHDGLAMLIGRFLMIVPILALAGNLAGKKLIPASAAHSSAKDYIRGAAHRTVLLVGALTFLPALAMVRWSNTT